MESGGGKAVNQGVLLTWIPLKYADDENRLLSLFRYD
jgi:hypothetical protein